MEQQQAEGMLAKLGIEQPAARAWAWYDWANSAVYTVVVTAIFPLFFAKVLAKDLVDGRATELLALGNTISLGLVACGALFLGALADAHGWRKRLLGVFAAVGILATAGLFFLRPGDYMLGLVLYGGANFGVAMSVVFYDSLLPHVAPKGREDQLSSTGFAFGYIGGGLLLGVAVGIIMKPELFSIPPPAEDETMLAFRIAFLLVAVWWALFSLPLIRTIEEPPATGREMGVGQAFGQITAIWGQLRTFPQAALLLMAFLLYSDGINTIIRMSAVYAEELAIDQNTIILVFLAIQFVAMPATLILARLSGSIGAKRVILIGIVAFILITIFAYGMSTPRDFWILGLSVGCVMGGVQALSRSLFARMIPRAKSGEFFGVFALGEKVGGALGPAIFFVAATAFDSSRVAILAIVVIFVLGGILLSRVDIEKGEADARAANAAD